MPKFSVILPTCNRASYVKEAIESVLAQTFKDFELLVIDDGSTDNTPQLLASYGSNIRSFRQTNQGRSVARNLGVSNAGGELIAFLDSDDRWLPEKLERQAGFLETHPEVSFLYGHVNMIGASAAPIVRLTRETQRLWSRAHRRGETYENWCLQCCCFMSTVVVRKKCLEAVGEFDSKMEPLEDVDLYLRISAKHRIDFLEGSPVSDYRVHPDNSGNDNLARAGIRVASKHLDLLHLRKITASLRRAERNLHLSLSRCYFVLGNPRSGRVHFHKAILKDPMSLSVWPSVRIYLAWLFPRKFRQKAKQWMAAVLPGAESALASRKQ